MSGQHYIPRAEVQRIYPINHKIPRQEGLLQKGKKIMDFWESIPPSWKAEMVGHEDADSVKKFQKIAGESAEGEVDGEVINALNLMLSDYNPNLNIARDPNLVDTSPGGDREDIPDETIKSSVDTKMSDDNNVESIDNNVDPDEIRKGWANTAGSRSYPELNKSLMPKEIEPHETLKDNDEFLTAWQDYYKNWKGE